MPASYDNRETCVTVIPSSCVPYTGYVSDSIKDDIPCRPNINDIVRRLQVMLDGVIASLDFDNYPTEVTTECMAEINFPTLTQAQINRQLLSKICDIRATLDTLTGEIDPNTIRLAINLLCLENNACATPETYSLQEILEKLITAYCSLLSRVLIIETTLNL